ncbi:hypothetical protein OC842_007306 [Tilletia horrida]|uniref:Uncharacterized protein n=1 Tax=Tilletia horrida TaxID=155126 RepID=A0AAN6JH91_9BASI|nr:hypothetical protein OC842_007306 [Tilletia horrida]
MRSSSQGACERLIGSVKSDLRSRKARYANLVRRTLLVEQCHLLDFVLSNTDSLSPPTVPDGLRVGKAVALSRLRLRQDILDQIVLLLASRGIPGDTADVSFHTVVRVAREGRTFLVRSRAGNSEGTSRLSCRVASVRSEFGTVGFHDVLVFVCRGEKLWAVAHPFRTSSTDMALTRHWIGGRWSSALELVDVTTIQDVMGQFEPTAQHTYLFPRKTSVGGYTSWWTSHWNVSSACQQWPLAL